MVRGLYTAASGMLTQWSRTDVLANNLANIDTAGFKFDEALVRAYPTQGIVRKNDVTLPFDPFKVDLRPPIGQIGTGAQVEKVIPIFTQGALQQTDQSLDVALVGKGLLAVQTPQGVRYTRDGSLGLTNQRMLVNRSGMPLLSTQGTPIVLPEGKVQIGEDGRVYSSNVLVAQLQVVEVANPSSLEKKGNNLFAATAESGQPIASPTTQVKQGYLEKANQNVVAGMVEMMTASRIYEANSRVLQVQDDSLDRLISSVGATS